MPRRGYRKRKDDKKEALTFFLKTRLSETEYRRFSSEADARSITLSKLARHILAAHSQREQAKLPRKKVTNALVHQFARIGNNLNQLARQANAGMVAVPEHEIRRCLDLLNSKAAEL